MKNSDQKKLIIANWKMNFSQDEAGDFSKILKNFLKKNQVHDYLICPPYTLINFLIEQGFKIGAQDCSHLGEQYGAYTGEISAYMLKKSACEAVIIGHYERRKFLNENLAILQKKLLNCWHNNLPVILCVGENLEARQKNNQFKAVAEDLDELLPDELISNQIIIAYEPIWAIGMQQTASLEEISTMHNFITNYLQQRFEKNFKIIYGGSVNMHNIKNILAIENVAGVLVGGASLDARLFSQMIKL